MSEDTATTDQLINLVIGAVVQIAIKVIAGRLILHYVKKYVEASPQNS